MALDIKLLKKDDIWVCDFLGHLHHIRFDRDFQTNWRSMGLLEGAAVEFDTDLGGEINYLRNAATGEYLEELVIPKTHSLTRIASIHKPLRVT